MQQLIYKMLCLVTVGTMLGNGIANWMLAQLNFGKILTLLQAAPLYLKNILKLAHEMLLATQASRIQFSS